MLLQNARNSGSGKIKGPRKCGYAQMKTSACTVFHVFYCIEECLEMHSFVNCCFYTCCWFFYTFDILYCYIVSEPGQQKHQSKKLADLRHPP